MQWQENLPALPLESPGQTVIVEARPGRFRRQQLRDWLEAKTGEHPSWGRLLAMDAGHGGVWAGVDEWLEQLLPEIGERAPELLQKHSFELASILPSQRQQLEASSRSLTDTASPTESVRNYAIDRAYRIGHGIIDLLDALAPHSEAVGQVIVCDDYNRAGALVRRFLSELMRRRGAELGLTMVLAVDPGTSDFAIDQVHPGASLRGVRLELPADESPRPSRQEMSERAQAVETEVADDPQAIELELPRLIRYWEESDQPARALKWRAMALGLYNHYGFYEDALVHYKPVLANLDTISAGDSFFSRWNLVGSVFGCLVAVGEVEEAYRVVREEAYEKIDDPIDYARVSYVMSMLHARFLPETDLEKAVSYLEKGLEQLDRVTEAQEQDGHFLKVFLNNGLALIRHRQGRPREAIELCREGYEYLEQHLSPEQHRLHRSVLIYNTAQVYSALHEDEEAIECFAAALEMDPNYSEYYNERGGVLLRMERYREAIADFHRAIETSPPYAEVWTNLGQCHRQMGQVEEAIPAYNRALDIDPHFTLALVGRAEMLDAQGCLADAEADYDTLLGIDPAQPMALANRAVIRYQTGRVEDSLIDLDTALEAAPESADLYHNRSFALADLGRPADAVRDLETYLQLNPAAQDRREVEARMSELRATA